MLGARFQLCLTPQPLPLPRSPLRSEADLQTPFAKYLCLALGMLFLGKQDLVEATMEVRQGRRGTHLRTPGARRCLQAYSGG